VLRELRRQAVRGASAQPEKAALCVNIIPSRCSQDLVRCYALLNDGCLDGMNLIALYSMA